MKTNPIDRADLDRGRATDPLVRASGLHHLVLETPDIDVAARFWGDFGLSPSAKTSEALYLRSASSAHHVLKLVRGSRGRLATLAFRVESDLDLRKLASLPEGSPVHRIDEPGGGARVSLAAPGGLAIDAVHGIAELPPLETRDPLPSNVTGGVTRSGRPVRVSAAPSEVLRLGHAAIETTRPAALLLWLMRTLGMIVSDYQHLDTERSPTPIVSFMRCDRGATLTDHHTLAVAIGPRPGLAHVAFEVRDVDEIGRGAAFLRARGYRHAWGIGRHILGSQLFDYWRAPDGIVAEHYSDGDVFDSSAPTGRLPFRGSTLAQWGEKPPPDFALPPLSPSAIAGAVRGIATSDEISVALLARAASALSR
ncbi:MAG TPA: VOC family protein [Polyangiaceae bacterium]|nr:VOC family protein [Polyangiaceae bacterium]